MARTKSGEKKKRQQSVQKRDETPEDEFEVETIVDSKGSGKSLLYMVKWRDYPESDNTWENPADLPKNLVQGYLKDIKQTKGAKKSPKKVAKKTPKKESPKKEKKPVIITGRKLQDNVVHYEVKGRQKAIPIYEFDDFTPVYHYEMNAPLESAEEGRMEPSRILEKKGSKYLVLWEGKQQLKTWETSKNLICFPLMKEFDDGTEDDSEDEIYEVKTIIGKRKMGRTYEYQVLWKGQEEDNATWEPVDNLESCRDKIRSYEKTESRKLEAKKIAKTNKAKETKKRAGEKRANESEEEAEKVVEKSPRKRGRSKV